MEDLSYQTSDLTSQTSTNKRSPCWIKCCIQQKGRSLSRPVLHCYFWHEPRPFQAISIAGVKSINTTERRVSFLEHNETLSHTCINNATKITFLIIHRWMNDRRHGWNKLHQAWLSGIKCIGHGVVRIIVSSWWWEQLSGGHGVENGIVSGHNGRQK